ncbi:hypothetical protein I552_4477 [Mycobacterium xenopi 3993]|nr:hypothetical protein I552_4477 [Mycobacterium xenopi 3993]
MSQAEIVARARDVIGLSVVQPVWRVAKSAAAAEVAAVQLLRERHDGGERRHLQCAAGDATGGLG